MARVRDTEGIAGLKAVRTTSVVGDATFLPAIERIALIMAAKGGGVRDITPGDCLELLEYSREVFTGGRRTNRHSPFFYQLLHSAGVFPASAPPTVRMFSTRFPGQLPVEQLVDRYDLACRPVRDVLVDYLRERQPGVDYKTLTGLATALALRFWKDLENHHPGISSLRLAPDIAVAWKQRIQTKTIRSSGDQGEITEIGRRTGGSRRDLDDRPGVLSRPGPMGPRRTGALGTVGRAVPDSRRRHPAQEEKDPPQGAHGPAHPRAAPAPARPGREGQPGTRSSRGKAPGRHRDPARPAVHRRGSDPAPDPHEPPALTPDLGRGPRHRHPPGPRPGKKTMPSGPGPPSKSSGPPASGSRN